MSKHQQHNPSKSSLLLSLSSRIINVSLPKKTRNNGTLYALVFVHQADVTPWQDPRQVHLTAQLTTYMVPKQPEISLISGDDPSQVRHCLKFQTWLLKMFYKSEMEVMRMTLGSPYEICYVREWKWSFYCFLCFLVHTILKVFLISWYCFIF